MLCRFNRRFSCKRFLLLLVAILMASLFIFRRHLKKFEDVVYVNKSKIIRIELEDDKADYENAQLEKLEENSVRRKKIVEMTKHAWSTYSKVCLGDNEFKPITNTCHSPLIFGEHKLGVTIIDALDTFLLMNLTEEYELGYSWIYNNLNFNTNRYYVSAFETNIRILGGLLGSYTLKKNTFILEKAIELAEILLKGFDAFSGLPYSLINMATKYGKNYDWSSRCVILSECGSFHLEFAYLTHLTNIRAYMQAVNKTRSKLYLLFNKTNVYNNYINHKNINLCPQEVCIGAMGDSFYEYLFKSWLLSGKTDDFALQMFRKSLESLEKLTLRTDNGVTYFGVFKHGFLKPKMGHLACFAGGLYALASIHDKTNSARYLDIAINITKTCRASYEMSPIHLGPEAFDIRNGKLHISSRMDSYYILRPEYIESLFYLYHITKDEKYRSWGWDVVLALEKYCRAEGGYSGIKNVFKDPPIQDNVQQSFLFAETFKYLFLLFSDDTDILKKYVFNTEGHMFSPLNSV